MLKIQFKFLLVVGVISALAMSTVLAAAPVGDDTFQLLANPTTGADNTGDGGTGLPADLNYYYVGQSFRTTMEIKSPGTTASNIWIDYLTGAATNYVGASSLQTGSYYNTWSNQVIDPDEPDGSGSGRIYSTGSNIPVVNASGTGNFGSVLWTVNRPGAAAYGLGNPIDLDINVGVIGATTESNISLAGSDLLDDEEDFQFQSWADTIKPFAENPNASNGQINVAVESLYTFDLRDTKNGEGDNVGVGTGMNTATPPGALTFDDDGAGDVSYTGWAAYACSGIWGTNLCQTTVNPPSPTGWGVDTRNWEYDSLYTVKISGYQDLASPAQDQLGDANGPNTMDQKTWTFRTETDVVPPQVIAETPVRGSVNVSVDTNITIDVVDKKAHPGTISGTGVVSNTCKFNVSSASFALTTFDESLPIVTVVPITFGYRFTIDPASDFAQNEVVSVSAFDCEDQVGNAMIVDNWTFTTVDADPPFVDQEAPADDTTVTVDGTINFHLKDLGVGVNLADTVVYVNGVYYTDGGGAGSVTTNGTRITFADSLDFNGGNYVGDTTAVVGASDDYTFLLDPEVDFVDGEAVTVIVYASDFSSNEMERLVYSFRAGTFAGAICIDATCCAAGTTWNGATCDPNPFICTEAGCCAPGTAWDGAVCVSVGVATCTDGACCGSNSSWDGTTCIGSGGGGGTSGGGGVLFVDRGGLGSVSDLNIIQLKVDQIDGQSVLVSWATTKPSDTQVYYDLNSEENLENYDWKTDKLEESEIYHSVVIEGLKSGQIYFFRPVSRASGEVAIGSELRMIPRYVVVREIEGVCPAGTSSGSSATGVEGQSVEVRYIEKPIDVLRASAPNIKVEKEAELLRFRGKFTPNSKLKIIID